MESKIITLSFVNHLKTEISYVIDPPCEEFILLPNSRMSLIIESEDLPPINVNHYKDSIVINIDTWRPIFIEINGSKEQIWGFDRTPT